MTNELLTLKGLGIASEGLKVIEGVGMEIRPMYTLETLQESAKEWIKDIKSNMPSKFTAVMATNKENKYLISWIEHYFQLKKKLNE